MDPTTAADVAILGAVAREVEALVPLLSGSRTFAFLGQPFWRGNIGRHDLLVGTTGLGKVNAAATTAALLQRFSIGEVWNVGSSGAYLQGPLRVGDVLITRTALCGDEGVLKREGVQSAIEIGIPIIHYGGQALFDAIPLDAQGVMKTIQEITPPGTYALHLSSPMAQRISPPDGDPGDAGAGSGVWSDTGISPPDRSASGRPRKHDPRDPFRLIYGPSVTVGMVSGDTGTAADRFLRFGAHAENMEGSAVVQTCFRFQIPVLECRGMSNTAGDRNKEHWKMEQAIAHCHGIILNWLVSRES